jgi:7-cyano-7-deazaguanine reductase
MDMEVFVQPCHGEPEVADMENPLGKASPYPEHYDPNLLFPIERSGNRAEAGIDATAFTGYDVWNSHELGWLDNYGKPHVRRVRLIYPSDSQCIVESKSLKLYFVSFGMTRFDSAQTVRETIERDVGAILGAPWLRVELLDRTHPILWEDAEAGLIDDHEVSCDRYQVTPELLETKELRTEENRTYLSHLLKTNCPITGQPDWATVRISFRARQDLDQASLLRYLVSYREHGGFHELCCEEIFRDLSRMLEPERLAVKCFFTRRGGIDINPCRFAGMPPDEDYEARYWRQ